MLKKIALFISNRWYRKGGFKDLLKIAIPLILSTGAWSIQHFVDRMFLTWYSPEAIAAAMPSGMLNFTIMSLFIGTASYVNTFVAQYYGSKKYKNVGPIVWQGIYIAIIGGLTLFLMIPLAEPIFRFVGHKGLVLQYEIIYFKYLCLGAFPAIASSSLSGFFAGRGRTWPIMWVNILATAVNLIMDYTLIFGKFGFPELGIKGAAIATVLSACFSLTIYLILISRPSYNRRFNIFRGLKFNKKLFSRLFRFGFPNGVQFFLDIAGFATFLLLMGRLGTTSIAATNIAFNINNLAFMPMIGFGIAVSVLVGQHLGNNRPDLAERSAYSGFYLTFLYMAILASSYILVPGIYLKLFASHSDPGSFAPIRDITIILLRFVAIYSIFDTLNIIFAAAIKGAGDTRFVMVMLFFISFFILVIPSYFALVVFKMSIYVGWGIASTYIITLGIGFFIRFKGGKWKSMRVIEKPTPTLPSTFPETPTPDI